MSYLTDRLRAFDPGSQRFAPRDAAATNTLKAAESTPAETGSANCAFDAEMRDVVDKFEAAFSELVPPAAAPGPDLERAANIDVDFMDEELRKAFGDDVPSHESPPRAVSRPYVAAKSDAGRANRPVDHDQNLSFEEAMATLRASEARGTAAAAPVDRAEKREPIVRVERQAAPQVPGPRSGTTQLSEDVSPAERLAANENWTTRSRKVWPKVAGAAAIALVIGTGVGYIAGKNPASGVPAAAIATTPEGGARLRFEYDLNQR